MNKGHGGLQPKQKIALTTDNKVEGGQWKMQCVICKSIFQINLFEWWIISPSLRAINICLCLQEQSFNPQWNELCQISTYFLTNLLHIFFFLEFRKFLLPGSILKYRQANGQNIIKDICSKGVKRNISCSIHTLVKHIVKRI